MSDSEQATGGLMAMRLRKMLYWTRRRGETVSDAVIDGLITRRIWVGLGYGRLGECLVQELGLDQDRAAQFTVKAIREGYEDAGLYGITDQA